MSNNIDVGIVMGSYSDEPKMIKVKEVLEKFGVPFAGTVRSAHRTPGDIPKIVKDWEDRGCKIFIAAAGMAAHLAGAIAAQTIRPVIAVPLSGNTPTAINGLDALLSSVQMPTGIPVATVAVDGAANAAYLAMEILAVSDPALGKKLLDYRAGLVLEIKDKATALKGLGWPD